MNQEQDFAEWFKRATEKEPYPYQVRFACEPILSQLVEVTGTITTTDNCPNPIPHQKEKTNG